MVVRVCIRCKKLKKHFAKNLCKSCYGLINRNKEKHKECLRRWREKNPEYFRDYYLIQRQLKMERENQCK